MLNNSLDIATLRGTHRICGVLTGTLAQLSQQNVFLGPPLLLIDEEVVLLIEDGVAYLIDDSNAHKQPSAEQASKWNKHRMQDLSFDSPSATKNPDKQKEAFSEVAIAKRLARQRKREAEAPQEETFNVPAPSRSLVEDEEPEYRFPMTRPSSDLPWYQPAEHVYSYQLLYLRRTGRTICRGSMRTDTAQPNPKLRARWIDPLFLATVLLTSHEHLLPRHPGSSSPRLQIPHRR